MKFRNFKMVSYVVYGRGSFNQLDEILAPHRNGNSPMIFLVDHFFENKPLVNRIPLRSSDKIIFADVSFEPKTKQVDGIGKSAESRNLEPSAGLLESVVVQLWTWQKLFR